MTGTRRPECRRPARLVLLAGVAMVMAGASARADSPIRLGQEFVVNGQIPEQQWRPQVAAALSGEFVVVWGIYGADVFGQRFDSAGGRTGGEFQLNTASSYEAQDSPSVGVAADGSFVVVWDGYFATDFGGYSIYVQQIVGRRYSTTGQPQGDPFIVNGDTSSEPVRPVVASAPDGRFVVVWMTPADDVVGRRFDSTGAPLGADFVVAVGGGDYPMVSMASDGSFVVAWRGGGIRARRYDSTGAPLGAEILVSETPIGGVNLDVAAGSDGRFVVTWQAPVSHPFYSDVLARRFDSTGAAQGPQFVVNVSTVGVQDYPTTSMAPDGSFVVAWADPGSEDNYSYGPVIARRFDSAGAPLGGEFAVSNEHPVDAYWRRSIDSAGASDGSFVVVWQSYDYYREIVGQRFGTGLVGCSPAPKTGCKAPPAANRGVFRFRDSSNDARDTFTWQWLKGEATSTGERGDPFAGTAYAFCLYDASGATQPLIAIESPAAGPCGGVARWRPFNPDAVEYFDRAHASAGLERIRIRPGSAGVARVLVRGLGEKLTLPATPLVAPVTVQLQGSHGTCWTATYSSAILQNGGGQFRAKPDAGP